MVGRTTWPMEDGRLTRPVRPASLPRRRAGAGQGVFRIQCGREAPG
jgi:hypothetical protein